MFTCFRNAQWLLTSIVSTTSIVRISQKFKKHFCGQITTVCCSRKIGGSRSNGMVPTPVKHIPNFLPQTLTIMHCVPTSTPSINNCAPCFKLLRISLVSSVLMHQLQWFGVLSAETTASETYHWLTFHSLCPYKPWGKSPLVLKLLFLT